MAEQRLISDSARVMIVTEEPDNFYADVALHEKSKGGAILSRILRMNGLTRDSFIIGRVDDIFYAHADPHIGCLLVLGDGALSLLTEFGDGTPKKSCADVRGYTLWSDKVELPVVASYSPHELWGRSHLYGVMRYDIGRALAIAKYGMPPFDSASYDTHLDNPSLLRMIIDVCREHPDWSIAYDIENPKSARQDEENIAYEDVPPTLIQFSLHAKTGMAFPWREPYISLATELLSLPNPKWGWNVHEYDDVVLKRQFGIEVRNSIDALWAWHILQPDLPRGLQHAASFFCPEFGPWKHTAASDLTTYACADVDIVQRIVPRIFADLKRRKIERGFWEHTDRLRREVLLPMRRMRVDPQRMEDFKREVEARKAELQAAIQPLIPAAIKKKHIYKAEPRLIKRLRKSGYLARVMRDEVSLRYIGQVSAQSHQGIMRWEVDVMGETTWWIEEDFAPGSWQQLIAYLKHKSIPVPVLKGAGVDGEDKETTSKKLLLQVQAKLPTPDPLIPLVIEYKELHKLVSTYAWPLDENNCIPTTYRPCGTSVAQMSSHDENVQNIPTGRPIDTKLRSCIVASPGCKLIHIDLKGFHAKMLGWWAKDVSYIRIADHDIHSFLTAHYLHLSGADYLMELSDEELDERLIRIKADHKEIRDKRVKVMCHATNNGAGANKIYSLNMDKFANVNEVREVQTVYKRTFPLIFKFQQQILSKCRLNGYKLESPFGHLRYFWDVQHWDSRQRDWVAGEDAEGCKAYLHSNAAHGYYKEALLRGASTHKDYWRRFQLCNLVHDSLDFDCPVDLVEECVANVSAELETPSQFLIDPVISPGGFSVGVDAQVGDDLGHLIDYKR